MRTIFLLPILIFFVSCASSYLTINVEGEPGTVISNVKGETLATIDQSGTCSFTIDGYKTKYKFYLAKRPGDTKRIPFALDYTISSGKTQYYQFLEQLGIGLASVGVVVAAAGGLVYASDNDNPEAPYVALGGLAGMAAGAGLGGAGATSLERDDINRSYTLKTQHTNNDLFPIGKKH